MKKNKLLCNAISISVIGVLCGAGYLNANDGKKNVPRGTEGAILEENHDIIVDKLSEIERLCEIQYYLELAAERKAEADAICEDLRNDLDAEKDQDIIESVNKYQEQANKICNKLTDELNNLKDDIKFEPTPNQTSEQTSESTKISNDKKVEAKKIQTG